jgi:hypothetical protein
VFVLSNPFQGGTFCPNVYPNFRKGKVIGKNYDSKNLRKAIAKKYMDFQNFWKTYGFRRFKQKFKKIKIA